jgi:hypothetical protein
LTYGSGGWEVQEHDDAPDEGLATSSHKQKASHDEKREGRKL